MTKPFKVGDKLLEVVTIQLIATEKSIQRFLNEKYVNCAKSAYVKKLLLSLSKNFFGEKDNEHFSQCEVENQWKWSNRSKWKTF